MSLIRTSSVSPPGSAANRGKRDQERNAAPSGVRAAAAASSESRPVGVCAIGRYVGDALTRSSPVSYRSPRSRTTIRRSGVRGTGETMTRSAALAAACCSTMPRRPATTRPCPGCISRAARSPRVQGVRDEGEGAAAPAREENSQQEREPEPQVDDEQRVAVEPSVGERHEQTDAIGIEQIEQRM